MFVPLSGLDMARCCHSSDGAASWAPEGLVWIFIAARKCGGNIGSRLVLESTATELDLCSPKGSEPLLQSPERPMGIWITLGCVESHNRCGSETYSDAKIYVMWVYIPAPEDQMSTPVAQAGYYRIPASMSLFLLLPQSGVWFESWRPAHVVTVFWKVHGSGLASNIRFSELAMFGIFKGSFLA